MRYFVVMLVLPALAGNCQTAWAQTGNAESVDVPKNEQPYSVAGECQHSPIDAKQNDPGAALDDGWQYGLASYYKPKLAGRKTANGEYYDPQSMTAAHRDLPFGAVCDVKRADWVITVRINDRGPQQHARIIDLSYVAALALGLTDHGIAEVGLRCHKPKLNKND
jgi:rare lipoprotein A